MTIIQTENLVKSFLAPYTRRKVEAVKGINLSVEPGEIFGFLGPNGAGKTTVQRMLTTLLPPDTGRATVAGYDLFREAQRIRQHIGYVSQQGGADSNATARENLLLQAQLYGMSRSSAQHRAIELLESLDMTTFADRMVRTYSGGQRRRLDLGLGIVHNPRLLFLDEPSTGLDPHSRAQLWNEVRQLRANGTTIFLTTHYLDEADALCDRLAIIDIGTIVAYGSPSELKGQIAGDVVTLNLLNDSNAIKQAQTLLSVQPYVRDIRADEKTLQVYVERGEEVLTPLLHTLESANLSIRTVSLARPSLNDVFLHHTGRSLTTLSS